MEDDRTAFLSAKLNELLEIAKQVGRAYETTPVSDIELGPVVMGLWFNSNEALCDAIVAVAEDGKDVILHEAGTEPVRVHAGDRLTESGGDLCFDTSDFEDDEDPEYVTIKLITRIAVEEAK